MHSGMTYERTVASGRPTEASGADAPRADVGRQHGVAAALLAAALLAGCPAEIDDDDEVNQGSGIESTRDAGPRVALVIGNEKYGSAIGRLENPVRDAKSVAQALEGAGFTVEFKDNLAENAFHAALDGFSEDSERASTAAFYYAGHGMEEGGVNYLLPVDMQKPTATHNAVELDEVIESMKGQRNLVFLDACRTPPPERGTRGGSTWSRGVGVVPGIESAGEILIAYAAAPKQPALDGVGSKPNSPYAAALAAHMGRSGQRLTDLLIKVRNQVLRETEGKQKPWQSGSLGEAFYFVPPEPSKDEPDSGPSGKDKPGGETTGGGGTAVVTPPSVVLPEWERECERILGIEDPARAVTVRAYVKKYLGEPAAAVCVADAQVLAGKLEKQAQQPPSPPRPPPVVSGTGAGATGSGTPRRRAGEVWESPSGMEFAWIPAGTFVMGSPEGEEGRFDDERQHEVRISRGFWMGRYEVTQGEWEGVMGRNPSSFKACGARCPVENVSWEDAQFFIERLNGRESGRGYRYRLPTEAEWEYAARAGTVGARPGELGDVAWWDGNSGVRTHVVGRKRANGWGLHDMLGNVWEWTADWYGAYPSGSVTDPAGPRAGSSRVSRGGSWATAARGSFGQRLAAAARPATATTASASAWSGRIDAWHFYPFTLGRGAGGGARRSAQAGA